MNCMECGSAWGGIHHAWCRIAKNELTGHQMGYTSGTDLISSPALLPNLGWYKAEIERLTADPSDEMCRAGARELDALLNQLATRTTSAEKARAVYMVMRRFLQSHTIVGAK